MVVFLLVVTLPSSESTKGDEKLFLDGGDIHKVGKLGSPLAFTMPGGTPCVDQLSQSSFFLSFGHL